MPALSDPTFAGTVIYVLDHSDTGTLGVVLGRPSQVEIREVLPGYETAWDAKAGAAQLHRVFASIDMDEATFTGRGHTRLKQIEYLMRTQQVDPQLYWTAP